MQVSQSVRTSSDFTSTHALLRAMYRGPHSMTLPRELRHSPLRPLQGRDPCRFTHPSLDGETGGWGGSMFVYACMGSSWHNYVLSSQSTRNANVVQDLSPSNLDQTIQVQKPISTMVSLLQRYSPILSNWSPPHKCSSTSVYKCITFQGRRTSKLMTSALLINKIPQVPQQHWTVGYHYPSFGKRSTDGVGNGNNYDPLAWVGFFPLLVFFWKRWTVGFFPSWNIQDEHYVYRIFGFIKIPWKQTQPFRFTPDWPGYNRAMFPTRTEGYFPPSPSGSWMVISQSEEKGQRPLPQVSASSQTLNEPILITSPRSTLSQNHPISDSNPLPPPQFHPKSKLPRLQYGGLPVPAVHCFQSSPLPTVDLEQTSTLLQATAKSLPSPHQFKKGITSFEIGFSSKLFCEIHDSEFLEQHVHRIADSLGTGGLTMYLQVWHHWAGWCHCHMSPPAEAPLSLILDYLHASDHLKRKKDSKPSRTRMMTHIKALRWIASKLDLPILPYLQSQTVSDFLKSQTRIPFERSEATPIPLAVLAAWEQRIISSDSSLAEILTLGCFLVATMASLRFRDLLRTKPDSLTVQGFILRGISWIASLRSI